MQHEKTKKAANELKKMKKGDKGTWEKGEKMTRKTKNKRVIRWENEKYGNRFASRINKTTHYSHNISKTSFFSKI